MASKLHVYYDLMSQPARAVLIFLRCSGVPFTGHLVDIRKGANRTKEYKAIHPFSLIPAIVDDGLPVMESCTIMKYVAEKYKVADHWYPSNLEKRTKIDEFLSYYPNNLRMTAAMMFREQVILPRLTGEPADTKAVARFQKGLEKTLAEMESYFLRSDGFIGGAEEISIADLLAICELTQPQAMGFQVESPERPRLTSWMTRVKKATEPHFSDTHVILEKVKERFLRGKL